MNYTTQLTNDVIRLPRSSDVAFGLAIPQEFKPQVEQNIGNGIRPQIIESLKEFSNIATANNVVTVAKLANDAVLRVSSERKFSLNNIGEIVKAYLSPIAAVIPNKQIEELDEKAVKLINLIDDAFPNTHKIKIGWEISTAKKPLQMRYSVQDKSSGYFLPLEIFLDRFRKPLEDRKIRKYFLYLNQGSDLEAKKSLIVILKKLFWYSGNLVEEWRNVNINLSKNKDAAEQALKIIKKGKWFILEFKPEKAEAMLSWIEKLHLFGAKKGYHFLKVAVLADYRNIETHKRARLRGRFGEVGATFERFPDGIGTFLEAVENYETELKNDIAKREAIRDELPAGKTVSELKTAKEFVREVAKSNLAVV